jgi:hypothetical protein
LASKEHGRQAAEEELASAPFDPSYMGRDENRRLIERHEWQILKELQRDERLTFFAEGKDVYRDLNRAIYREVREEFRSAWASYYAAKRDGLDAGVLMDLRAGLIARQEDVLAERRELAAPEKRSERDLEYRALLDTQKEQRSELIDRQELGVRSPELLDRAYPPVGEAATALEDSAPGLAEYALDRFGIQRGRSFPVEEQSASPSAEHKGEPIREHALNAEEPLLESPLGSSERQPSRDVVSGLAGGVLGALGSLGDSLMGGHSKPKPNSKALSRFGVQRGQPPPGDAIERAARERNETHEERREWREWHHLAEGQDR